MEVWEPAADPVNHTGDLTTTFGAFSPEWLEGLASQTAPFGSAATNLATTDFVGIAVHCANASSSICANNPNARPDVLPDEPGGYHGFQALFGAKYVDPAITGGLPAVQDVFGTTPIADSFGPARLPRLRGMSAAATLGYVAKMQEAGIPVTYAYISDVRDNHAGGGAYGPGEAGYVAALQSYDQAFARVPQPLAADGIDQGNTLFIRARADERTMQYAGEQAQGCDGVTTPVASTTPSLPTRDHGQFDLTNAGQRHVATWTGPSGRRGTNGPLVGEIGYNMSYLLGSTIDGTAYDISFDSAPSFYIDGQLQAVDGNGDVVVNPTLRDFSSMGAAQSRKRSIRIWMRRS